MDFLSLFSPLLPHREDSGTVRGSLLARTRARAPEVVEDVLGFFSPDKYAKWHKWGRKCLLHCFNCFKSCLLVLEHIIIGHNDVTISKVRAESCLREEQKSQPVLLPYQKFIKNSRWSAYFLSSCTTSTLVHPCTSDQLTWRAAWPVTAAAWWSTAWPRCSRPWRRLGTSWRAQIQAFHAQ